MTAEELHARHLAELGFLQDALGEAGLSSRIFQRSADVPYHTLLADLEADGKNRARQLALNFYPLEDEEFADTLFLQYFIGLPFALPKANLAAVSQLLPAINNKVVLGHFGVTDGDRQLHFRYVQALPSDEIISAEKVADVVTLVTYTPVLFQDVLEAAATGELSLAEARKRVEDIYADGA